MNTQAEAQLAGAYLTIRSLSASHDRLRNALGGLIGLLQLLEYGPDVSPQHLRETVRNSCQLAEASAAFAEAEHTMTAPERSRLPRLHVNQDSKVILSEDSRIVASVTGVDFTDQENIEHARLIVTAVNAHAELLAAAKEAVSFFGEHDIVDFSPAVVRRLRAAIAKAEEAAP